MMLQASIKHAEEKYGKIKIVCKAYDYYTKKDQDSDVEDFCENGGDIGIAHMIGSNDPKVLEEDTKKFFYIYNSLKNLITKSNGIKGKLNHDEYKNEFMISYTSGIK